MQILFPGVDFDQIHILFDFKHNTMKFDEFWGDLALINHLLIYVDVQNKQIYDISHFCKAQIVIWKFILGHRSLIDFIIFLL
jgi:hypothetical protein